MNVNKATRYFLIPLVALLAFWFGGFAYFKSSDDWQEIQTLLAQSPTVTSKVGHVREITISPMPFMYRFSGNSGSATLRISITGSLGEYRMTIEAKKTSGVWSLSS